MQYQIAVQYSVKLTTGEWKTAIHPVVVLVEATDESAARFRAVAMVNQLHGDGSAQHAAVMRPDTVASPPLPKPMRGTDLVFDDLWRQLGKVDARWQPYSSCHEALGLIYEELREIETQVFAKQEHRLLDQLRHEFIDLAVVCIRSARDLCSEDKGRK